MERRKLSNNTLPTRREFGIEKPRARTEVIISTRATEAIKTARPNPLDIAMDTPH